MEQPIKTSPTLVVPANRHHPFYPVDSRVPGYIEITTPTVFLLIAFFGGVFIISTATKCIVQSLKPKISSSDVMISTWFVLCGFIHTFFEGLYTLSTLLIH